MLYSDFIQKADKRKSSLKLYFFIALEITIGYPRRTNEHNIHKNK